MTAAVFACVSLAAQEHNWQREKAADLGRRLVADLRREVTAIEIPIVQRYVEQLGKRLVPDDEFTFAVIAEDRCPKTHEPVALPGGYVFVAAALFASARDEVEFARMLARAMEISRRVQGRVVWVKTGCSDGEPLPPAVRERQRRERPELDALAAAAVERAGLDPAGREFAAAKEAVSRATYKPPPAPPTLRRK